MKTLVDATFATPVNCRPATYGIDLVVHSATKYLAGHNDVLAGVVCGRAGLVSIVRDLRGVLGSVCDPHAAFLVERGMKTLALRVERQNATASPSRASSKGTPGSSASSTRGCRRTQTTRSPARQMRGFGGVVSFIVRGGLDAASAVVDRLKLARIAPSFGGVESLVEQPAVMSFYAMTRRSAPRSGSTTGSCASRSGSRTRATSSQISSARSPERATYSHVHAGALDRPERAREEVASVVGAAREVHSLAGDAASGGLIDSIPVSLKTSAPVALLRPRCSSAKTPRSSRPGPPHRAVLAWYSWFSVIERACAIRSRILRLRGSHGLDAGPSRRHPSLSARKSDSDASAR